MALSRIDSETPRKTMKNKSSTSRADQVAILRKNEQVIRLETTPMDLLSMAVNKDLDMAKLKELMQMQKEFQMQKAKESFFLALSEFQSICPEIKKAKKGHNSKYAPLGIIDKQIRDAMRQTNLSKRWTMAFEKEKVIVTCWITHKDGHSESTSVEGSFDSSGNKSQIHSTGSSITYLERYSLIGALGISTADEDDDGRGAGKEEVTDLPKIKDEDFKTAMKSVIAGEFTVAQILEKRLLMADQLKSLETAEKARQTKKTPDVPKP